MKVLAKDLQKAIKRLERVVETKRTMPVLRHVRVRLDGDHLALEATDLEAYVVTRIPVEEAGPIDVAAPLDEVKAAAAVATNAAGTITISTGEGLRVGPVTIRTLPVEEFPALPGEVCVEVGTAPEAPLLEALKAVAPAVCTEESRLVLRTISWELRERTFAATDGHRLHVVEAPVEVAAWYQESLPKGIVEVLLPARPAHALLGCLGKEAVRVGLSADRRLLRVAGPDYTLWIRPVDATFPNWRQVIPREGQLVVLERRALLEAAIRAGKVRWADAGVTRCLVLTENGPTLDAVLDRGGDMPVPC
ncbi:MAG: hypothetical protein HY509_04660, partial [Acidobacteria bacterium]|nr:hypothetical protein [Acidobacteriota bacterium]